MWITDRHLNAKGLPRPVRVAYLIPESAPHELLDRIIEESLSRWGGRRTPFIPTDGCRIDSAYWKLLDYWDADVFYSFCDLSAELQDRLYYSFAPSEIIMHAEANSVGNYRPIFRGNYQFLSSLSLLPLFDRRKQTMGASLPEILDNEFWDDEIRDFADSFGFVLRSFIGSHVHPHAKRASVRPERQANQARQAHEQETAYAESIGKWIEDIAQRPETLMIARLADMLCPSLRLWSDYKNGWDDHLTVVVGDSLDDRLLMWHAQHRYSVLNLGEDIPVLRVSPKRLQSNIPDWIVTWIAQRNHRQLDHSNMKQAKLKSCSLPKDELDRIAEAIRSQASYVLVSTEHHATPNVFTSENLNEDSAHWSFPNTKSTNIRFYNNELDLPLSTPFHIDLSKVSHFSQGIWAVELSIDRMEDHSQASNLHHAWMFPRRLRLETAITFANYASPVAGQSFQIVPPPPRPTRTGNLMIWDCADWTRPMLKLPTDYAAFRKAIYEIPYNSPAMQRQLNAAGINRSAVLNSRFDLITISDKGRDLLGVLQFFRSLPEALMYLNDQFWLQVIMRLLPEELQEKTKYIKEISKMIDDLLSKDKEQSTTDISNIAKRALDLAAQSYSSQEVKIYDFEALYEQAKKHLKLKQDRGNELRGTLVSSITHLRNQGFLWQGFCWKCPLCEHENWLSLERLTAISYCEICRRGQSSPVDGGLHFRLNPFVQHAFASSSAQGTVLWCLNQLASMAEMRPGKSSFSFAPALDLYTDRTSQPVTDIDITANINGFIYLVEVKRSFVRVNQKVLNQLLELGEKLRPDVILLAVYTDPPQNWDMLEPLKQLDSKLQALDVKFKLLTPKTQHQTLLDAASIALPYGKPMTWSAW